MFSLFCRITFQPCLTLTVADPEASGNRQLEFKGIMDQSEGNLIMQAKPVQMHPGFFLQSVAVTDNPDVTSGRNSLDQPFHAFVHYIRREETPILSHKRFQQLIVEC